MAKTPARDGNMTKGSSPKILKVVQKKAKRTSGSIRADHQQRGALLIEFAQPMEPMDMVRRDDLPIDLGPPAPYSPSDYKAVVDRYRVMERKGFRVTKDIGCLIPDEQYGTYQGGATIKGHQRAFAFFARWCPEHADEATRNEYGWPVDLQVSHLCHRRSCCRMDHIVAEEQFRNLKRNYCGANGVCDCGNEIKCLRRYQSIKVTDSPELCKSKEEVAAVLAGAPPYVLHGPGRYTSRDAKAKQRKSARDKRKRSTERHQHATLKKQKAREAAAAAGRVDEALQAVGDALVLGRMKSDSSSDFEDI